MHDEHRTRSNINPYFSEYRAAYDRERDRADEFFDRVNELIDEGIRDALDRTPDPTDAIEES